MDDTKKDLIIPELVQNIYGEYIAYTDECYIASKENSRILNITMATPHDTELNERNPQINTDSEINYDTALRTPESDYSILPEAIADLCKDKQLHWIQPTTDKTNSEPRASRIKRQLGIDWCWVKVCTPWKSVEVHLGNGEWIEIRTRKCWWECHPCPDWLSRLCSLDTSSDNPLVTSSATSMTTTTATSTSSETPSATHSVTPSPFYSGDYSSSFSGWGDYSSSSGWDFSSSYYYDWGDYSSSYSGSGDYSYMSYK